MRRRLCGWKIISLKDNPMGRAQWCIVPMARTRTLQSDQHHDLLSLPHIPTPLCIITCFQTSWSIHGACRSCHSFQLIPPSCHRLFLVERRANLSYRKMQQFHLRNADVTCRFEHGTTGRVTFSSSSMRSVTVTSLMEPLSRRKLWIFTRDRSTSIAQPAS